MVLGIIMWGTGQFASYAVFGHHRPLNAVIVSGIVLLASMSSTFREELPYIVVFTGAALFLLIQMHAFDERATWIRRRIGDPSTISSLYLRGGTVFILAAMLGSLLLTNRAASSPLAGAWAPVHDQLIEVGETLGRFLPVGGDAKGTGVTFGAAAKIAGKWFSDDDVAFSAILPATEKKDDNLYWRAVTFNAFILGGWDQTDTRGVDVPAGNELLAGSEDVPTPGTSRKVRITIRPEDFHGNELLSPGSATSVDQPATARLTGDGGWFTADEVPLGTGQYTVDSDVLELSDVTKISGGLLTAAPEVYPQDIHDLYTAVPPDAMGPAARALLDQVKAQAKSADPYDLAQKIVQILSNQSVYHYDTDVTDQQCAYQSQVECFAQSKRGYCLHYASTMAILLRAANPDNPDPDPARRGLPARRPRRQRRDGPEPLGARLGRGLLPDLRLDPVRPDGSGRRARERDQGRHGRGAVHDPAGPAQRARSRPARWRAEPGGWRDAGRTRHRGWGSLAVRAADGPPHRGRRRRRDRGLDPRARAARSRPIARGSRCRRRPRGWASARGRTRPSTSTRTASRELVPVATADLNTVAEAKVETSYARARLGGDRLSAVSQATRRLRVSLLRLAFRRGRRRSRKPKSL